MATLEQRVRRMKRQNVEAGLRRRHRRERRFRLYGMCAALVGLGFLLLLFSQIALRGHSAFIQHWLELPVFLDEEEIDPEGRRRTEALADTDCQTLINRVLYRMAPEMTGRRDRRALRALVSADSPFLLCAQILEHPEQIGQEILFPVPLSGEADAVLKGQIDKTTVAELRRVSDAQIRILERWDENGAIRKRFNSDFFRLGDSREPERAGIGGALRGSLMLMVITMALSFPFGVLTAIYLEAFAPKNRLTDVIEITINNLAAVPSIVFGLLGLAIFLNWFGLPRSSPLVGGLVLSLMTLPTIIIGSRAALAAVPHTIAEAALGIGASRLQTVFHHILPVAMPGILTSSIIGMAQALGETAPLLMIGMVAFIADIPGGFTDPAAALPVQIFLWADSPERAFSERAAAAIMVLLVFLIAINLTAVLLRHRLEKKRV